MKLTHSSALGHVTRRTFLGKGAALAAVVAAGSTVAQPGLPTPLSAMGPRVWLDLDQSELDAAYDQSVYAPNLLQIIKHYATNSEIVLTQLGSTRSANAPIQIFIHGGAWRGGAAKDFAYAAEMFVHARSSFCGGRFQCGAGRGG